MNDIELVNILYTLCILLVGISLTYFVVRIKLVRPWYNCTAFQLFSPFYLVC